MYFFTEGFSNGFIKNIEKYKLELVEKKRSISVWGAQGRLSREEFVHFITTICMHFTLSDVYLPYI